MWFTMWKYQNFSVTQILREIKVGKSGVSKSAILTRCQALNFDIYEFFQSYNAGIAKLTKFRAHEMAKKAFLEFLDLPKLISRKICESGK